ncbi:MAG: 4a-hydroxytetrahydrobiopterin dehydratase [Actinomycetota bacterium]|nr:4a-hydroxytetrahydrobiopterin dehydratase [Actinomycetota bacterium]
MTDRLAHDAVDAALVVMPEWERADGAITATYAMPTFPIGILLVDRAAELAEAANHHPDINVRWRRVTFLLTTHDSGGLTTRDLSLAEGIHAAALALGWDPAA